MKQILFLFTGMFLLLQSAAGQEHFLISGTIQQPNICMQKTAATDSEKPLLYLLDNGVIAQFPVAGNYTASGNSLCYEPLYPLANGKQFLLRASGYRDTILQVPEEKIGEEFLRSVVANIYPLKDSIPENILFFHVQFTQAMQQSKQAWKYVHLLDENGILIPDTWRQRSFWLDSGRLLVLMIHPGRVKSGIRYTGRVFEKKKKYTLTVDSNMLDFYGRNIAAVKNHSYYVLPEQIQLLQHSAILKKVEAASKNPVAIKFQNGVDHAAAITNIKLYDAAGNILSASINQSDDKTINVVPTEPWPKGRLKLQFSGGLYDCTGNRLSRLFEMKNTEAFNSDNKFLSFTIKSE